MRGQVYRHDVRQGELRRLRQSVRGPKYLLQRRLREVLGGIYAMR
jgi:hypothetical protein